MNFRNTLLILVTCVAACDKTADTPTEAEQNGALSLEEKVAKTPCGDYVDAVRDLCRTTIVDSSGVSCHREYAKLQVAIQTLRASGPDGEEDAIAKANNICKQNLETLDAKVKANPPYRPSGRSESCVELSDTLAKHCFEAAHIEPHAACDEVLMEAMTLKPGAEGDAQCEELSGRFD